MTGPVRSRVRAVRRHGDSRRKAAVTVSASPNSAMAAVRLVRIAAGVEMDLVGLLESVGEFLHRLGGQPGR